MSLPKAGDNPKLFAARVTAALKQANDRLRADRDFYDDVRREFGRD